jgi:hypothetical protein
MDDQIYSKRRIEQFENENLFFKDAKLKKYYDRNLQRDLGKFRSRVHSTYPGKDFERVMYLFVTNSLRDIILETIGELSDYMKNMGDMIVSGGEAFNLYVKFDDRIITPDIDAKFVPRMPVNPQFFGKLQATKLILWDKLGEISKRLSKKGKGSIVEYEEEGSQTFQISRYWFQTIYTCRDSQVYPH